MKPANTNPAVRRGEQRPASEEPRTGVVRRVDVSSAPPDATRETALRPRANASGAWRCLELAKVTRAELADGPWRSGEGHSQPQGCVKDVDLDVNPDSPYDPKRRLRR